MIFGEKTQFAIELQLLEPKSEWLNGHIGYWIGGESVGNHELVTSLRDFLLRSSSVLMFRHRRFADFFWDRDAKEAFREIDRALYGHPEEPEHEDELIGRFDFTASVDAFDEWKIYLLQMGDMEKLLYAREPYEEIKEFQLQQRRCDDVLIEVFHYLDAELEPFNPKR